MQHTALIFDLDGVLVDTAKYHYLAWKALAEDLNIPFTLQDNERLKGVSRRRSLEIILEIGGVEKSEAEQEALCAEKNALYLTYIRRMGRMRCFPASASSCWTPGRRGTASPLALPAKTPPDFGAAGAGQPV